MPRGGEEERGQMPRPWYRYLSTLLEFYINQWIKRSTVQYFNTMVLLKTSRTTVHVSWFWLYSMFRYILFLTVCLKIACHEMFSCIKAIGFEYFKLARSVLKIGSFEFEIKNFQYFNSTFMNIKTAGLVLNAKCRIVVFTQCSRQWLLCDKQNIVHPVAYIYMLTSN